MNTDNEARITFDELIARISPEQLDRKELEIRTIRATFQCPLTVRNWQEFTLVLGDFELHYRRNRYGSKPENPDRRWFGWQLKEQWKRHLGMQSLDEAETNAIKGREGAMPRALDRYTDLLVKLNLENLITFALFSHTTLSDSNARKRLITTILQRFATLLFPGEELKPPTCFTFDAQHTEQLVIKLALTMRAIEKQWRHQ